MWKSTIIVLMLVLTSIPAFAQQTETSDDARIAEILDAIQALEARVKALEDQNALLVSTVADLDRLVATLCSPEGTNAPDIAAQVQGRPTFVVEEVRRYATTAEETRIASIEKEIAEWEKKASEAQKKIDADRRRARSTRGLSSSELGQLQGTISESYRETRKLKGDAARIRREISVPRFWLMGWDGQRDVMLLTTRDEAELMRVLRQGDAVQWIGEVVDTAMVGEGMRHYQTVVADRVWRVPAEVSIAPRPEGREPVWTPLIEPSANPKSTPLPHLPIDLDE